MDKGSYMESWNKLIEGELGPPTNQFVLVWRPSGCDVMKLTFLKQVGSEMDMGWFDRLGWQCSPEHRDAPTHWLELPDGPDNKD